MQQLVADFNLPAVAQQLHTVLLLEQLASHLRSAGLAVEVMSPPRPDQRSPLTTRSIRDPFLVVSAESVSSDVDGELPHPQTSILYAFMLFAAAVAVLLSGVCQRPALGCRRTHPPASAFRYRAHRCSGRLEGG